MNCPGCGANIIPQINYCGNCGTGLRASTKHISPQVAERYWKFLFVVGIFLVAEPLFFRLLYFFLNKIGFQDYNWLLPLNYIFGLFFAGLPLIVAMLLPKNASEKNVLFVLGIIFLVIRMIFIAWRDFFHA